MGAVNQSKTRGTPRRPTVTHVIPHAHAIPGACSVALSFLSFWPVDW